MSRTPKVAIIGGIPAGLAAAVAVLWHRLCHPDDAMRRPSPLYGCDVTAEKLYRTAGAAIS